MSHTEFDLTYDGPAVESGMMDVRDLAPALLGVGQLIEAANRVLYGSTAVASVRVRTVRTGSFNVGLDVGVTFLQTMRDMWSGPEATAAANLIAVMTFGTGIPIGAIKLIKMLKGRQPTAIHRKDGGRVEVEINGQRIEVDEPVARVAVDLNVRLALESVIAEPLAKEGIVSVQLGAPGKVECIQKGEGYYFLAPPNHEAGIFESRYRAPISIISLLFKEGNKWRVNDGKAQINATVSDEEFLAKLNRNEVAFAKDDILICDVRVVTRKETKGLKSEYFIERVVEHRQASAHQMAFYDEGT
jgi:hypothetical protein